MAQELATPLYQQIAERMESMIEAGSLRAGDRIPSVRQLSVQQCCHSCIFQRERGACVIDQGCRCSQQWCCRARE